MRDGLIRFAKRYGAGEELVDAVLARNNPVAELARELATEPNIHQTVNQSLNLLPKDEGTAIRRHFYRGQPADPALVEAGLARLRSLLAGRSFPPQHRRLAEALA